MDDPIGTSQQSVTNGRLTLKKPHLEFLGNPSEVILTYGPGRAILILAKPKWLEFKSRILGEEGSGLLSEDQMLVERRLVSNAALCEIDEQSRLRVPATHLRRGKLEEKSSKAQLVPSPHSGWIELWNAEEYDRVMDEEDAEYRAAFSRAAQQVKREQ